MPVVRTGYHIGGHYELYQAEGVNPSVFSYIVGDVTIELARLVDAALAHQIVIGEFTCEQAGRGGADPSVVNSVSTPAYVSACNLSLSAVLGTQLSGKNIDTMSCRLTEDSAADSNPGPRRLSIVDKHGLVHHAYNLQLEIDLEGQSLSLGLESDQLPDLSEPKPEPEPEPVVEEPKPTPELIRKPQEAGSTEEVIDDLASMLRKRSSKTMRED